jgi:hypothetical protein
VENLKSNDIKLAFISSLRLESEQTRDNRSQKDPTNVCETNFACLVQK